MKLSHSLGFFRGLKNDPDTGIQNPCLQQQATTDPEGKQVFHINQTLILVTHFNMLKQWVQLKKHLWWLSFYTNVHSGFQLPNIHVLMHVDNELLNAQMSGRAQNTQAYKLSCRCRWGQWHPEDRYGQSCGKRGGIKKKRFRVS